MDECIPILARELSPTDFFPETNWIFTQQVDKPEITPGKEEVEDSTPIPVNIKVEDTNEDNVQNIPDLEPESSQEFTNPPKKEVHENSHHNSPKISPIHEQSYTPKEKDPTSSYFQNSTPSDSTSLHPNIYKVETSSEEAKRVEPLHQDYFPTQVHDISSSDKESIASPIVEPIVSKSEDTANWTIIQKKEVDTPDLPDPNKIERSLLREAQGPPMSFSPTLAVVSPIPDIRSSTHAELPPIDEYGSNEVQAGDRLYYWKFFIADSSGLRKVSKRLLAFRILVMEVKVNNTFSISSLYLFM